MPKNLVILLFLLLAFSASAQDAKTVCLQIDKLNTAVLNAKIKRDAAAKQFQALITKLQNNDTPPAANWVFPLEGYRANAIGGYKGNGYSDKGYNYLDGNKHSAHPAHDIFINDKNQDDIDDRTKNPVNVLAVSDGLVIACSNTWEPASPMRGGKYIWIYHPGLNIITYYAHNRVIYVQPGDVVKQGQKIAEVGRTGLNAYKKRSPTHLHFSAFKLKNGLPVPYNPYQQLVQAKKS